MLPEKIIAFPKPAKKQKTGRRADGRVAKHFRYKDQYGQSHRKTVYGQTIREAESKKREFLAEVDMALRIDQQGRTVASFVDEWLKVYKKPNVTVRTYVTYDKDCRIIKAAIGGRPIKSITQSDLQAIVNTRAGLSSSAIRKTAMTIKAVFKTAFVDKIIAFDPSVGIMPVKGKTGSHRALTDSEIEAVIAACGALDIKTKKRHRYATAAMLMLFAGLRKGEVAAFSLSDDVENGQITVRRAASWPSNQAEIKDTKSRAGQRVIPIFSPLDEFLDGDGLAIVGVKSSGSYISETAFNTAHSDFVQLCGVKFTPHDLRHTFATILYDAGVDVKTAQLWLGHDDPTVTMRIYTHLSKTRKQASTDQAKKYFSDTFSKM